MARNSLSRGSRFSRVIWTTGALPQRHLGAAWMVVLIAEAYRPLSDDTTSVALVLAKPDSCGLPCADHPGTARVSRCGRSALRLPPSRPVCVALEPSPTLRRETGLPVCLVSLEGDVKGVEKTNTWNSVGRITGLRSDPLTGRDPPGRSPRSHWCAGENSCHDRCHQQRCR